MSKISYVYTKLRKEFGKQPLFQSVPAHIIDSISSDRCEQKNYCLRNPVHREVQATLPQAEHEANTNRVLLRNVSINHTEGGWPKDVHIYNEEHVMRYRRRVCHDDNYIHAIKVQAPVVEHYIDQNNAIEMYESYFKGIPSRPPVESHQIRIANSFVGEIERSVSCIAWTHEPQSKLAVAYCDRNYNFTNKIFDSDVCYIWNIENQTKPAHEIYPSNPCWQLACSPIDPHILVGGLQDGTVSMFDVRAKEEAIYSSPQHVSHRSPITSLLYTHSRTNTEFFSGSLDGQCIWWDVRQLSQPLDNLLISLQISGNDNPTLSNSEGISALQFDRGFPTKFLCGTESGLVVNVNRIGRTHSEVLSSYWEAHLSSVRAVHRSPCTYRMFITCGDWTVKIWSEEVHSAPIIFQRYKYEVCDVIWAPLRWSSYMSVCAGGFFYYWDLLRKYDQPVTKLSVSKNQLTKISAHNEGQNIAVGDSSGNTFLIQLSENMIFPEPSDKMLMQQIYDRERKREHILEARVKEIRLKQKLEEELGATATKDELDENEILDTTEKEFWKTVKKELSEM